MASDYNISTGPGEIELEIPAGSTIAGVQVISTSALDGAIILKLKQSSDGVEFNDMPEIPITADAGANTNLLQTNSFVVGTLYLDIDVLSATVGELNFVSFGR